MHHIFKTPARIKKDKREREREQEKRWEKGMECAQRKIRAAFGSDLVGLLLEREDHSSLHIIE